MLPPSEALRVDLLPNVRAVQGMTDLSWADRVLTEAVEAAATTGDRRLAASALVQRGFLRLFTGAAVEPRELIDVAERAIAVFDELDDELGLARAWRLVGQAHYLGRRVQACVTASERALEHVLVAGDPFEEREIVEWLVIALTLGTDAGARSHRTLRAAARTDRGPAPATGRDPWRAGAAARDAGPRHGDRRGPGQRQQDHGGGRRVDLGRVVLALDGLPVARRPGRRRARAPARVRGTRTGRRDEPLLVTRARARERALHAGPLRRDRRADRECELACRPNDVHSHILWRSIRAKVLARGGRFEEAEQLAREAVALAETSDFLPAHAGATEDLPRSSTCPAERTGPPSR